MYYPTECDEKLYASDSCRKQLSHEVKLNVHLSSRTREKPYACEMCPKQFTRKRDRNTHYYRVHTEEKPYVCYICSKVFARKSDRTAHYRVHTGEKPHACDICQKTFTTKGNLKSHLSLHNGDKPYYTWSECHKQFSLKDLELKKCSCKVPSRDIEISELEAILPVHYKHSLCEWKKVEIGFYCRFRVNIWTKKDALKWLEEFTISSQVIYTKEKTFPENTMSNVYKVSLKCHRNTKPRSSQPHPKHSNCPARLVMTVKNTALSRNYQSTDIHLKEFPTVVVLLHLHNHLPDSAKAVKSFALTTKNEAMPLNQLPSFHEEPVENENEAVLIEDTELPEQFVENVQDNTVIFKDRSSEIVDQLKIIFDEISDKVKNSTDIMVAAENFIRNYNKICTETSLSSALNNFGSFSGLYILKKYTI